MKYKITFNPITTLLLKHTKFFFLRFLVKNIINFLASTKQPLTSFLIIEETTPPAVMFSLRQTFKSHS